MLAGLRTYIRRQKLPFLMFFQMVIGTLGIFSHRFFLQAILLFSDSFLNFPAFDFGFGFLVEFYIDNSGAHIFFNFFSLWYNRGNTRCKNAKNSFFAKFVFPLFTQTWDFRHFCILCFLDYTKVKKNKKNMRTTIIDVKFDGESKSEVRIGLPCKEKPENAENCRKILKLLLEKTM